MSPALQTAAFTADAIAGAGVEGSHESCDRLTALRRLAGALRAAIADFASAAPVELLTRAAELEGLCDEARAAPASPAGRREGAAEAAQLLRELTRASEEVRRLNQIYAALVRESRRTVAALLRAVAAGNAGLAGSAAEGYAAAPACVGTELRVSS